MDGSGHFQRRLPGLTLLTLALASGVAWRVELEMRSGWASLAWLSYFHWAVPLSVLAFIAWAVRVTRVRRPSWFATTLLGFAFASYVVVDFGFHLYFAAGPSGLFSIMFLGRGDAEAGFSRLWILQWLFPALWALLPLAFYGICRFFGVRISIGATLVSAVLFTASWPIAVFIRGLFEERGSPDLIHALKSGCVIPFLILSLGLPLLRSQVPSHTRKDAGDLQS